MKPTPLGARLGSIGPLRLAPVARERFLGILAALALGACERESVVQLGEPEPADPTPQVAGVARYRDTNFDGQVGAGDVLVVPFSTDVVLTGNGQDFSLPVTNDSLGTGSTLARGPGSREITVTLGDAAKLKSRQTFVPTSPPGQSQPDNSPSGIDVVAMDPPGIRNANSGEAAASSVEIDVFPAFVEFSASGLEAAVTRTRSVALGDVDGDGSLDLVQGTFEQGERVWINNGEAGADFRFTDSGQRLGSGPTQSLLTCDVDRDGDLDLVAGNADGESDSLWRNDGAGAFTLAQTFGSEDTTSLAVGDIDGDGDPDLFSGNRAGANVVWENLQGLFPVQGRPIGDDGSAPDEQVFETRAVALGDLNKDGHLDLIEGNADGPDRIYLNDEEGSGEFEDFTSFGDGDTSALDLGDIDSDGDLDLAVGDGRGADRVWLNSGAPNGQLADSGQELGDGATQDLALVDLDGDAVLELVLGLPGETRVFDNEGTGRFTDTGQSLLSAASTSIALGDVDGNADVDLVTGSDGRSGRVFRGSLGGTRGSYTLTRLLSQLDRGVLVSGDVDADHDPDLLVQRTGMLTEVWLNDGSGSFFMARSLAEGSDLMALGDLDRDGDLDLVMGRATAKVWENVGSGGFSMGQVLSDDAADIDLVDLDRDGKPDVVLSGAPSRTWLNGGEGVFTSGPTLPNASVIGVGDVDTDGDPDLILLSNLGGAGGGLVLANDGQGRFFELQSLDTYNCGNRCQFDFPDPCGVFCPALDDDSKCLVRLSLGDLDADGDPDFLEFGTNCEPSMGGNRVWRNDGGLFTRDSAFANSARNGTLVDIDGDADLDFVGGRFDYVPPQRSCFILTCIEDSPSIISGDQLEVWVNDNATFAPAPDSLETSLLRSLAAGDIDGDGDVDVFVDSDASNILGLWFNR